MIVVSDTSPLTALLAVGEASILTALFGEVVVPGAVRDELLRSHSSLPAWVHVAAVKDTVQAGRYALAVDSHSAQDCGCAGE